MNSLILRLLVEHRMLSRELRRERSRPEPDKARLLALHGKRLKVKLAIARHLPRSGMLLKLTRKALASLAPASERMRRTDKLSRGTPRCL